jgi:hypothetical protein
MPFPVLQEFTLLEMCTTHAFSEFFFYFWIVLYFCVEDEFFIKYVVTLWFTLEIRCKKKKKTNHLFYFSSGVFFFFPSWKSSYEKMTGFSFSFRNDIMIDCSIEMSFYVWIQLLNVYSQILNRIIGNFENGFYNNAQTCCPKKSSPETAWAVSRLFLSTADDGKGTGTSPVGCPPRPRTSSGSWAARRGLSAGPSTARSHDDCRRSAEPVASPRRLEEPMDGKRCWLLLAGEPVCWCASWYWDGNTTLFRCPPEDSCCCCSCCSMWWGGDQPP